MEMDGDALRKLESDEASARLNTFRNQAGTGRGVEGLAATVAALRDGQVAALFIGGRYTDGATRAPGPSCGAPRSGRSLSTTPSISAGP